MEKDVSSESAVSREERKGKGRELLATLRGGGGNLAIHRRRTGKKKRPSRLAPPGSRGEVLFNQEILILFLKEKADRSFSGQRTGNCWLSEGTPSELLWCAGQEKEPPSGGERKEDP